MDIVLNDRIKERGGSSFSFWTSVRTFAIITGKVSSSPKYIYFKCLGKDFNSSFEACLIKCKIFSLEFYSYKGELTNLFAISSNECKDIIVFFMSVLFRVF
jgi:hypothetical protein